MGAVQLRHVAGFFAVTLTSQVTYGERAVPLERLRSWADKAGVYPCGSVVGVFFGSPAAATAGTVRYSLCLPVSKPDAGTARAALLAPGGSRPADLLVEGDVVEVREFPRILAAVAFYRGEAGGAAAAYGHVNDWVRERPYLPTGAPREVYLAEPGILSDGRVEIEVLQPVIPKPK